METGRRIAPPSMKRAKAAGQDWKDPVLRFRRRNGGGKNPDGQGFKSGDFFAHFAKKYDSSLDGLDRRNGTPIAYDREMCYTFNRQIGICRFIFHQPLFFQGIFAVKCLILMFCPCFCPYQPKQGQILYCPTTISSSFADFFFASLVAWAYTFIVVLTSECPRSSCTSFGCSPFSNRFVV